MSSPAELLLADILDEPATLARVLEAYGAADSPLAAVRPDGVPAVRLIGMGSSRYAALPAALALRARGVDAAVERASLELASPPRDELLAVCISANGASAETLAAAERHRGRSVVVAVTNREDSPLAEAADVVLPLGAGEERAGVACRTFQATLVVLSFLAARVAGAPYPDLRAAVEALEELIARRDAWLAPALDVLGGDIHVLAPAERMSSALQGALMFREGPRLPAHAAETGDWSHVDVYLTRRPGYRALVFAGSPHEPAFSGWMERRGGAFVSVGAAIPGASLVVPVSVRDPAHALVVETTVAELLACELWRRSLSDA